MRCIPIPCVVTVVSLILLSKNLSAQNLPVGAEAAGLGFATVALEGNMGVWGNVAGLNKVRNRQIMSGYENRYGLIEGLHVFQAAYLHPLRHAALAVSLYRFGDALFSHHKLSLSVGQQIGQFSTGIRLNQHQYSMEGADTRFALAIDAGGIMKVSEQLLIGMHISNVSQARISRQTGERIPSILSVGFNYTPDKQLNLLAQLAYEIEHQPVIKVGLAYEPLDFLVLRTGINSGGHSLFFFGLGLKHSVLHFDYALEAHPWLGISQHVGLVYHFPSYAKP